MKLPELTQIELGEPWKLADDKQGVAVPVLQKEPVDRNYVLHTEVEGKVVLEDTGGIHRLKIKNNSEENVFVRRGTMLKGKTQHRAVVSSIVAAPESTTSAEIRCIFASKGISGGAVFMHAGYAPRAVASSLHKSQSEVWNNVKTFTYSYNDQLNYISAGEIARNSIVAIGLKDDDLTAHYEAVSDDTIIKALKNVPADMINQIGIIILDIQGVQGIEIFDHPESWKELSKSVIRDYANILSKPVPEYYTFDMERVKEFVTDFMIKLISMNAEPVWEEHHAQTYQFENDELLGEYTLLEGDTIHIYVTRKEGGIKTQKPSVWRHPPLPLSPVGTYNPYPWYPPSSTTNEPYAVPATTYCVGDINPTTENMNNIMRYATQKRGNETLQALYTESKTFSEIQEDTLMSSATVSKALKEAETLELIEKAYRSENGKSVYRLTELGKKINPKKFKA